MSSAFENALDFMGDLGVYTVVLPFILTFVIIFAILEKTLVLGKEKDGLSKKNLNSLVAFCIAFFVVASQQLVSIINQALGQIVIVALVLIFYLALVGIFFKNGEDVFLENTWRKWFMVATLGAIILIFANAIPAGNNRSWLEWAWYQITHNFDAGAISAIILVAIIIGVMYFVVNEKKDTDKK
ncbi:MAG: hypothetical protein ACMXYF_02000 [Candidatus Woesearchaeota archaeon]